MIAANKQSPCLDSALTSSTCSLVAFGRSLMSCLLSMLMFDSYLLSALAFDNNDCCTAFSISSSSRNCVSAHPSPVVSCKAHRQSRTRGCCASVLALKIVVSSCRCLPRLCILLLFHLNIPLLIPMVLVVIVVTPVTAKSWVCPCWAAEVSWRTSLAD